MTKKTTKISAFIALFAILASIFSTWILVILDNFNNVDNKINNSLTQSQINELFKTKSWTTNWNLNTLSWETLTWTKK